MQTQSRLVVAPRVSAGCFHITAHALVRWLERAKGYDIDFFRERCREYFAKDTVGDAELLGWLENLHGIDVPALRHELSVQVQNVSRMGLNHYRTDDCVLVFDRDGRGSLVTIITHEMYDSNVEDWKKTHKKRRKDIVKEQEGKRRQYDYFYSIRNKRYKKNK